MIVTGIVTADLRGQHYMTCFEGTWPIADSAFDMLWQRCKSSNFSKAVTSEPVLGNLAHGRIENGEVVELEILIRRFGKGYRLPGDRYRLG